MTSGLKKQCALCQPSDSETETILQSIEDRLYRLMERTEKQNISQKENSSSAQGFYRLIRIVFATKFRHSKQSMNCRHQELKKLLLRKLKCSLHVLNSLCDQLAATLSTFNFHLDTLTQQMKGFQRYIRPEKNQTQQIRGQGVMVKSSNEEKIAKTSVQEEHDGQKREDQVRQVVKQQQGFEVDFQEGNQIPGYSMFPSMDFSCMGSSGMLPTMNYMWYYPNQ